MSNLGEKIRNLRHKIGLTQGDLAERSDLTKGFISQVENGNTSPSIDTMEALVTALGTNMSDFFKEEINEPIVYQYEEAFSVLFEQLNSKIHWIVPNAQKNQMEPVIMELFKKGKSKIYNPFEGEAFGYVLQGKIKLIYGDEEYEIGQGDSFYFEASKSHLIENSTKEVARVLWVLTPPNF